MNRILTLYILRQLAGAFAFATGAVTFVVLFTQSFRLLTLVIESSSTMLVFFQLMLLSALSFLPFLMPLGLGAAVVFVYNRLAADSELVVMRAAGIDPFRMASPALLLAGATTIFAFMLTLWLTPAAQRNLVRLQSELRESYAVFLSHPGSFNDLAEGLTFYANRRGAGGTLQGILIHDVRDPAQPVTTMAASGQVVDSGGQSRMIIFNGRRQEFDRTTGKLSELAFDQYVLDLDALRNTAKKRLPDLREQSIVDLFAPSDEMVRARGPITRFKGEIHSRFAVPLLSLSYTLIGLAAVTAGAFNRRGMVGRILTAALCIVVLQAVFMTLNGFVARDDDWTLALYATSFLPAPIGFFLIMRETL
jgi:lipopolysaccharide export system permease protein